jgi:hypothetical protein
MRLQPTEGVRTRLTCLSATELRRIRAGAISGKKRQQASARVPRALPKGATSLLPDDRDLAVVLAAWPELPEAVRASIVAMIKAASK